MNRFEWVDAASVEGALAQLAPNVVPKAGGVDLLDMAKERLVSPARLVNLRNIPGLDRIEGGAGKGLELGPLVTLARLDADPRVRAGYAALADAALQAATPQIRNMATLGGNLLQRPRCWYFRSEDFHCRKKGGETCFALDGENQFHAIFGNTLCAIVHPSAAAGPLVAHGARIELTSKKGAREIVLEEFFVAPATDVLRENVLAPDELLTAIRIPALAPGTRSAYVKLKQKESFDWPLADVSVVLELDGSRCKKASVVLGAAAPIPWRARLAEAELTGKTIDDRVARAAAKAAVEGATPLARNRYKRPVFEAIVRRALLAAVSGKEAR
jgi:xanthine dehydrogenase YagS FAD-binding subunit